MVSQYRSIALVALFALALAACAGPGAPVAPTPSITPAPRATMPEASPPPAFTATTAPTTVSLPTEPSVATAPAPEDTPTPLAVSTDEPVVDSDNLIALLLGPVSAPAGWIVEPCEGSGPLLCVLEDEELVGIVQLSIFAIETLPDFQDMLDEAGLEPTALDYTDPETQARLRDAFDLFVVSYHESIETDRQTEYGDRISYERLETQNVMVGEMPGVQYGFAGVEQDGTVYERWISYMAFDGELMYILVAPYREDAVTNFRSDEELQEFLPHLTPIVAGLRLPLPVVETDVTSVRAVRTLTIFRAYGDPGNPVGQVGAGQTIGVTGASPHGRYWRVECPGGVYASCWIEAGPDAAEPVS